MSTVADQSAADRLAAMAAKDILVVAPAGCGKTQALAQRAARLLNDRVVTAPRKILALTFSNKARDNLSSRLKEILPPAARARVTVTNFHGLAGRLVRAHGDVIGVDPALPFPERGAYQRLRAAAGLDYRTAAAATAAAEKALAQAKTRLQDDDAVMAQVTASGARLAVAYERTLREAQQIDYDDLLRYGARLLADLRVARLYREHFAVVLVDEVQDLSPLQLGMVQAIGAGRTTYAGDPAQGIYSFAGARPATVFAEIRATKPAEVGLDVSYRSSPPVLHAVNQLAAELGATQLRCADPDRWPADCGVELRVFKDTTAEAEALLSAVRQDLADDPNRTVGIMVRNFRRLTDTIRALDDADVAYQDWYQPTIVPQIAELMHRNLPEALSASDDRAEQLAALETLCRHQLPPDDAQTLDELSVACEALGGTLDVRPLQQTLAAFRLHTTSEGPVPPGLHLLTGHAGKGQEFDIGYVIGLEEGGIPDFRSTQGEALAEELRVLHVMASRARHRLVFTRVENRWRTPSWYAPEQPSRWWDLLNEA
ncbi:UvrD-helicase domain-containing protein [Streptomyces sp. NPDC102364]|uniref:UvrD-helicase domain-containing protein n=1 Tax=Streptomyces sp. NPDC102364 TaxID=3366161 RepID=UPI00380BC69C